MAGPTTETPPPNAAPLLRGPAAQLFALSFAALFLELMLIRWVPSVIEFVAYYANLLLIASFLGLGLGVGSSKRGWRLFRFFPLLLALLTGYLVVCREASMPSGESEMRYYADSSLLQSYVTLVGLFLINTGVFVALGERIGDLFRTLPPLGAYRWDLLGSLAGTVCFGAFSYLFFSPFAGMALVLLLVVAATPGRGKWLSVPFFCATLFFMTLATDERAIWSPYHYITVHEGLGRNAPLVTEPVPDLQTRSDPPRYSMRINQHFYQEHWTIDPARHSKPIPPEYGAQTLPHALRPGARRVLILGSGGGMEVEAALLAGAEQVEAVEIDPALVELSRRFSASAVYRNPRVHLVIDDARARLLRTEPGYDVVVFGFLDSQALFSTMSNVRLDGYVHTVEGIRAAWRKVSPDGMLSLAFAVKGKPWLVHKLTGMVREGTGREPLVYTDGIRTVFCAFAGEPPEVPAHGSYQRVEFVHEYVEPATDDWPYLYLSKKTIPFDYAVVIGILVVVSLTGLAGLRKRDFSATDVHFMFLGVGFLLLETKSIMDCSLFFGATWLVTGIVVAGVLVMVLAANEVAARFPPLPIRVLYAVLYVSLAVVCLVPRAYLLELAPTMRLLWTLLVIPLPLFFAGLIFSSSFRAAAHPSAYLSANLIGATLGGFSEYLGMWVGREGLFLLLLGAYAASAFALRRSRG